MPRVTRAYRYYVRPVDAASEAAAINEVMEYARLRELYRRLKHEPIVPYGPLTPELAHRVQSLRAEAALDGRRRRSADIATDRSMLKLEATRAIYSGRRCCYTTARLAQQAGERAKHRLDAWAMLEGRAGMLPERVQWDGPSFKYSGTAWTLCTKQWRKRPIAGDVRSMYLSRERWTPCIVTRQRFRWYLIVTLDIEEPRHAVDGNRCSAGLDLAWRYSPERPVLRVAYLATDHGQHYECRVDERAYQRMLHARAVQSTADSKVGDPLRKALGLHPRTADSKTVYAAGEQSSEAKQLVHLARWHHGQKRNAIASRNEHYILTIHALCRRYHTIYIEAMKGKPQLVARLKTVRKLDPEAERGAAARDQRQALAAFTFLRTLQAEAPKFGTQVVEVDPAYTSRQCSCGVDMGDSGPKRERRCDACGRSWDVDYLAAWNLLTRGAARIPGMDAAE